MLKRILPLWHLRRGEFAHALARANEHTGGGDRWRLWAYHRLGMHATVAGLEHCSRDKRSVLARAVGLAACGRYAEAESLVQEGLRRARGELYRSAIGEALAPFMPRFALGILSSAGGPAALQAALMLRTGQREFAESVLERAIAVGHAILQPELYLHYSNALRDSPGEQLARLNGFLEAFDVPPVVLCDQRNAPSPCNVSMAVPPKFVDGPLVSVLMTAYQTGERADVAIRSVLGQSYRNIELIVVDDASRDNTPDIVKGWAARDSRVRYIRLSRNCGTYVAKNIGLQYTRGDYVTCHDSDDWSHPLKIERQVAPLLEDGRLVATTSSWIRMQDDGVIYARSVYPLMRLNPSSPLFRKESVLAKAGIWDAVRTGADSEFIARLKIVFGRSSVRRVGGPLTFGSHRPNSLMTGKETGYDDRNYSHQRLAYVEAWRRWHIDTLRQHQVPYLDSMHGPRPFHVSGEDPISNDELIESTSGIAA